MLESHKKSTEYCTSCPKLCQSACPVAMTDANETHTPWGMMQTLNMVINDEISFDEDVGKLSYQCLTCRACTEVCEHDIDVPGVLAEARKIAVELNLAPPEIAGYLEKFHRYNNPFAKDLLHKLKDILPQEHFEGDSPVAYFASCTTIAKCPDTIRDTFELFEKLKINFVRAYPETIQCCGYPLISSGLEEEFLDLAEINFHALRKYKTIITGSPACAHTLRETYKKYDFGLDNRIVTVNQFIEPYLQNINFKIKKNIRTKLMYHDPCYSSRYLDEVDLPRELIGQVSGYEPIEFFNHGKASCCSGQGGCFSITSQDVSNDIAKSRLEEVYEKDVKLLVTQCPSCVHKFRKNSKRVVVKDLMSYLNDCIEGSEDQA